MDFDSLNSNVSYKREFGLEQACLTNVGKRRSENQDSYAVAHSNNSSLYLVADGMGGAKGGATASSLAVEIIARLAFGADGQISERTLSNAIECANQAMLEFSKTNQGCEGMGTTLVALAIVGEKAIIAHVGDSRIYRLSSGALEQLTKDHSLLQELIDSGNVEHGKEEKVHPMGHVLTRSIGPMTDLQIEIRTIEKIKADEIFLLCCDGFSNHAKTEIIKKLLSEKAPLAQIAKSCISQALGDGGSDNVSVVLLKPLPLDDKKSISFPPTSLPQIEVVSERRFSNQEIESLIGKKSDQHVEQIRDEQLDEVNIFQEIIENEKNLATEDTLSEEVNSKKYVFLFILLVILLCLSVVVLYQQVGRNTAGSSLEEVVPRRNLKEDPAAVKARAGREGKQEQIKRRASLFTWQQEKPRKLSKEEQKKKLATEVAEKVAPDFATKDQRTSDFLLTAEEKSKIIARKKKLRGELSDIDLRILMLSIEGEEGALPEVNDLKSKAKLLQGQIEQLKKQMQRTSAMLVELRDPTLSLSSDKVFSFAKRISPNNVEIAGELAKYREQEKEYRKLKSEWEKDPQTQQQNAAKVAAQGRVLRSVRDNLTVLVEAYLRSLKTNLEKSASDSKFLLNDLEEELADANRHIGFWSAFRPIPKRLARERREALVQNRDEIVRKLLELRLKVADEQERGIAR